MNNSYMLYSRVEELRSFYLRYHCYHCKMFLLLLTIRASAFDTFALCVCKGNDLFIVILNDLSPRYL